MGTLSLGATSPRRPPSHHELQSDPYKMRVFLAVLLLASARADKPAVAPAYTGAATVDETFGSALKRDAPAAAAPDSYGSPVAAPAQDTYGSPSAPVAQQQDSYGSPAAPPVASQDSYGSPQAPVQTATQSGGPGNQGYYYYYYPVRQNVPEAQSSDDGGLLGGLLGGGLSGILTTKALLLILGLAGFVLIATIGIGFNGRRAFSSRALKSLAEPYLTSGNLIALLESVNSAITKYEQ